MIADATEEYIQTLAPKDAKETKWNAEKIKWTQTEGNKGAYEKSIDYENPDHKALIQDLVDHKSKLSHDKWFYWLFTDNKTVGRKQRAQ